ncbi:hypothetical protein V8C34DRAFT_167191 [Trichoderma compactum]
MRSNPDDDDAVLVWHCTRPRKEMTSKRSRGAARDNKQVKLFRILNLDCDSDSDSDMGSCPRCRSGPGRHSFRYAARPSSCVHVTTLCTTLSSPCQLPPARQRAQNGDNPQPTSRKELQPQPALQPRSGPLASEAFLDRQRTGGLWAQRAQQLVILATGRSSNRQRCSKTLQLGRLATTDGQQEAPFA